ncbi:MAG TPA: Do family serine endopeptidase, partial [Burkholderiaceae bacterium]|nr:Do family serine endopeptidase [Burkholderiaceae bacterium]
MPNFDLKPLAWALLGAGVAVVGTAGAFDMPSWLHHHATAAASTAPATSAQAPATLSPAVVSGPVDAAGFRPVALVNPAQPPLPPLPPGQAPNWRAIVQEFGSAVVHVDVSGTHKASAEEMQENGMGPDSPLAPFFRGMPGFNARPSEQPFKGLGSGFIVSSDGLILTNAHVVNEAKEVTVKLQDRREYTAKVLGVDTSTDIAVIRIAAKNLPVVHFGDPAKLMVGDYVLAIGAPYGLDQTATSGIVSAKGRSLPSEKGENFVPFIQTDAAVNPGNSGGPLFDAAGNVMGINSQIYSRTGGFQGVSFAIPIDLAMKVKDQIVATGHATHARLGVTIQQLDQDLAESFGLDRPNGALVATISPNSAAAKAGLKAGDVITKVNGPEIDESGQLSSVIGLSKPGDKVTLDVWRDKKNQTLVATLGASTDKEDLAQGSSDGSGSPSLGLALRPLNRQERGEVGASGLVVEEADGAAGKAGVEPGDVVLAINGKPVATQEDVKSVLAA